MKNLIYKNKIFYLTDEIGEPNGQSSIIPEYDSNTISNSNMPHHKFINNIVIYGRKTCPFCIGTLSFLKKNPELYKKVIFVEIDSEPSQYFKKSNLINILNQDKTFIKGYSTVPMVFDNGKFIGGSTDSEKHFNNK